MNSLDDLVAAARDSLIKGLVFDTSLSPGWNDPPPPRGTLFAQVRSPGEARDMLDRRELLLVLVPRLRSGRTDV